MAGLWGPLRTKTFRQLIIADLVSDVGTFMQGVGSAWLMVSLGASPLFIALTQTATTLPFFLFALPAGAIGDIADRRKLILATEAWMLCAAVALAAAAIAGVITPWLLLALTFALSAGDAIETPTWRAVLPELVRADDLPAASALNGIEFNIARAVGPALAGALIAAAGVSAAFVVNVASFLGVIVVVARWKRPAHRRTAPPETFGGATAAAIRYVRHSPAILTVTVRSGLVMLCASAPFALLPAVARSIQGTAIGYGVLLGCFGAGAVGGGLLMPAARARWSTETVVSSAVAVLGAAIAGIAWVHVLPGLMILMLVAGGAWLVVISIANALVQTLAPDWVRARVLSIFMLVTQGGLAGGSALWGLIGSRTSLDTAFAWAGVATMAAALLGLVWRLPEATGDVSPWNHWKAPAIASAAGLQLSSGPVLISVQYRVEPPNAAPFLRAMQSLGRVRRRDGAFRWTLFRDVEDPALYVETFLLTSWDEHLRQHERVTRGDAALEQRIRGFCSIAPVVRHLLPPEL